MPAMRVADLGPRAVEHFLQAGEVDGAWHLTGHGYLAWTLVGYSSYPSKVTEPLQ
ncbi:hypothetical protein Van01_29330 [Micromonospora andamanensis]|uniref:Uncharacterized protein n=1 Tax=Micromonospora andamanensis TaxID=1287068 RepID=A0ABQ4HVP4_9ACTN|nr:hypothetical protein Van01_29330 [Micromonospora andamanensis]